MLDYRVEIVRGELGRAAYACAALYINGTRINHVDFTSVSPSKNEIESKLRMLALHLYFNSHYEEYKRDLFSLAFPYGM